MEDIISHAPYANTAIGLTYENTSSLGSNYQCMETISLSLLQTDGSFQHTFGIPHTFSMVSC